MSKPPLKIALVCDWLTNLGGAEKVLLELHRMYPEAPIYTSQYRPKRAKWFKGATVKTGWLQIFPVALRRFLSPLRQVYFSHLDLTAYDLVISVTGAEAKGIRAKKHLCYCHVPTQYYWQMYDEYLKEPGFGFLNPIVRLGLKLLIRPLRRADYRAAQRPTQFVAISHYTAEQIKKYYNRDAVVIAPNVDVAEFAPVSKPSHDAEPHFIISCRQVTWKRVDLAIRACLEAKRHLWVIGDGPEHRRLTALAQDSPLIEFIPWVDAKTLVAYLSQASAYLFPSCEPFGIAAVEALAAGCPVIAYDQGGSRDFITPGKNGIFFPQQTVSSLVSALRKFDDLHFNRSTVTKTAQKFSSSHFRERIEHLVHQLTFATDTSLTAAESLTTDHQSS